MVERMYPRTQAHWTYHDLDDLPADLERYDCGKERSSFHQHRQLIIKNWYGRIFGLLCCMIPKKHWEDISQRQPM